MAYQSRIATVRLTSTAILQQKVSRMRLFWHTLAPADRARCLAMEQELQGRATPSPDVSQVAVPETVPPPDELTIGR